MKNFKREENYKMLNIEAWMLDIAMFKGYSLRNLISVLIFLSPPTQCDKVGKIHMSIYYDMYCDVPQIWMTLPFSKQIMIVSVKSLQWNVIIIICIHT